MLAIYKGAEAAQVYDCYAMGELCAGGIRRKDLRHEIHVVGTLPGPAKKDRDAFELAIGNREWSLNDSVGESSIRSTWQETPGLINRLLWRPRRSLALLSMVMSCHEAAGSVSGVHATWHVVARFFFRTQASRSGSRLEGA